MGSGGIKGVSGKASVACKFNSRTIRIGARRHGLPERYGKYKNVHPRLMRWARSGVWERIFAYLVADKKNQYLMIDSIIGAQRRLLPGHPA